MQMIADMKELIMEIISTTVQEPTNIQATQQMGVSLSNAVKREGVVIIQNQNVEVISRIVPSLVNMLRMCDSLEKQLHHEPVMIQHEPVITQHQLVEDPVNSCCEWMFENNIKFKDMQEIMKSRYLEYVISQYDTKAKAARKLGIGSTYLSKLTRTGDANVQPNS